jgi:hypothetical protein
LSDLSTNLPPVQVAFGERINSTAVPNAGNIGLPNAVPFNLSDVTLFASTGRNVHFLNALTGAQEAIWSTNGATAFDFGANISLNDLAVAPNGQAVGFQNNDGIRQDSNSGTFVGIDIGNGAPGNATSGLTTWISQQSNPGPPPTFETIQVPNNGGNNGIGMIAKTRIVVVYEIVTNNVIIKTIKQPKCIVFLPANSLAIWTFMQHIDVRAISTTWLRINLRIARPQGWTCKSICRTSVICIKNSRRSREVVIITKSNSCRQ